MRFALVAFALPLVYADVQFVAPAAGGFVPAGSINAVWQESGEMPLIADLTQYSLALMVGGNEDSDMVSVTLQNGPGCSLETEESRLRFECDVVSVLTDHSQLSVATFVSQGDFTTSSNATGTIPAGITGDVPNGL